MSITGQETAGAVTAEEKRLARGITEAEPNPTAARIQQRRKWAEEARSKMSPQTQGDVDAVASALSISTTAASDKYRELMAVRGWKMWEALAVKDIALALAGVA